MEKETIKKLITEYDLKIGWDHQKESEGVRTNDAFNMAKLKANPDDMGYIKENKQEIMSYIKAGKGRIKKEEQENWEIALTEAEKAKIISIEYRIGCDCTDRIIINYNIKNEAIHVIENNDIRKIKKINLLECVTTLKIEKTEATLLSYGTYKFNTEQSEKLMEIANNKEQEKNNKIEKKKAEKEKKRNDIFIKAKETGERQVLESYSTECQDENEECDIDFITIFALPDGTTEKTHNHTW